MNNNQNSLRKEIVEKADIVNIISQYVNLEKRGNNYIGLCPFHDDKNPSMSVSPQKKVFKCFSCGVAGDVISFVSKIKNITISEAMREIGETVGIKVSLSKKDILKQKYAKYYNVLKEANDFFNFYLTNTIEGKKGIEYLESRKLSIDEIKRFNIGLAGENDVLYKTLIEKEILPIDMIEVGLLRGGDHYRDVFKNRIMFPIKDLEGNVVGFSGRRYLPDSQNESKYINTSETILFRKGDILYNYSDCSQDIKISNNVYLFEGFMDVIAAVKANVLNSVASMGTALTNNQISAIKRLTNNVTLCFDSDGPGVMATVKAIYLMVNEGLNVNVCLIPDGKDADEYIFNNGNEALHKCLVNNIISAIEFLYNYEKRGVDFSNYNELDKFKNNIFKHVSLFKSNILVEKILNILSKDLNVSLENLLSDYNKTKKTINTDEIINTNIENDNFIKTTRSTEDIRFEFSKIKYLLSEKKLILAAYYNKKTCFEIESLLENQFYDRTNRDVLHKILSFYRNYDHMIKENLFEKLTFEEKEVLEKILTTETLPLTEDILVLIKNIKEWAYASFIQYHINNEQKTEENLQRLTEYKKQITKIKIKR